MLLNAGYIFVHQNNVKCSQHFQRHLWFFNIPFLNSITPQWGRIDVARLTEPDVFMCISGRHKISRQENLASSHPPPPNALLFITTKRLPPSTRPPDTAVTLSDCVETLLLFICYTHERRRAGRTWWGKRLWRGAHSHVVCKTDDIREWFIMLTCVYIYIYTLTHIGNFFSPENPPKEGRGGDEIDDEREWEGNGESSRMATNYVYTHSLSHRKNARLVPHRHQQPLGRRLRHYYYHNEIDKIDKVFQRYFFFFFFILTWFLWV